MNGYRYETHLHTSESSACGKATGAEQVHFLKAHGYQGLIVTDHFLNGNTRILKSLPWEEQIDLFCRGYEEAKKEGDKIDFDVFFGVEWNFNNDEFLLYGIDRQWLLAHPDMLSWSHTRLFEEINKIGGLMLQAHPFRIRSYVKDLRLYPYHVHGIEVTNAQNEAPYDNYARRYASYFSLAVTSGSDLHWSGEPDRGFRGISTKQRMKSVFDYVDLIRNQKEYTLITSDDDIGLEDFVQITVPVMLFDAQEQDISEKLKEIFNF